MVHVEHTMHVIDHQGRYDMILDRDVLQELGIDLDLRKNSIMWGDYQADMKSADITMVEQLVNMEASRTVTENIAKILDNKYCKVNLQADIAYQCSTLNTDNKKKLIHALQKHKELFDDTLGTWKDFQYNIELQDGAKLYHGRPYTIPKACETTLCVEVEHLCCIGVLHKVN
eukprot:11748741-Ditylum_brightwellii.AAC.1